MSNFRLDGKTAIITGGAGGLGVAMSKTYAEAGANVVVASRNVDNCRKVVGEIEKAGGKGRAIAVDITDEEQVNDMVEETVDTYGRLDIIVNNAGRWGRSHRAEDTPLDEWRHVLDVNLTACLICCLAAGRQMIKQEGGKIVNISSTAGSKGNPGQLHYSAAKAGVISLTNNLAYMWAPHNINVNCILPGLIATEELKGYPNVIPPMEDKDGNPVPRLTRTPEPENVADLALFLASPAADLLTGELYPIRAWLKSERFWQ